MFAASLSMIIQVNKMVKTSSFHLLNIGLVREQLTKNSTKQPFHLLVILRLDYCNKFLWGLSSDLLLRFQLVQNKAARLITRTRRQIILKTLLLVFKGLHNKAPQYILNIPAEFDHCILLIQTYWLYHKLICVHLVSVLLCRIHVKKSQVKVTEKSQRNNRNMTMLSLFLRLPLIKRLNVNFSLFKD